jgi:aminotransferase
VTPRFVTLEPPDWTFPEESLRAALGERTRAIVVNTPGNPCGKVFTRSELDLIGRIAAERDLFVLTDEIYEHFLYDGRTHVSPASIPSLRDRTVTINGFSKTLSITGWRIGFSACPRRVAERLGFINDLVYICAPAPLQLGVARALRALDDGFYAGLAVEYAKKRDRICTALDRAGLPPIVPQGAYYVLADLSRVPGASSKERVMRLLESTAWRRYRELPSITPEAATTSRASALPRRRPTSTRRAGGWSGSGGSDRVLPRGGRKQSARARPHAHPAFRALRG